MRRFIWTIAIVGLALVIFLMNVSKPGAGVIGCLQGCATLPVQEDDGVLRLMSLNMRHGHPDFEFLGKRLELIAAEIQSQGADIVCLQEAPWTPASGYAAEYLAQESGMNYAYLRANGNRWAIRFEEGAAILSRYPIWGAGYTVLEPRAGFFENRVVLHAVIEAPGGDLDVFVTHLTHGDAQINAGQAAELYRYVEAERGGFAVVAGDFNAQDDEPQILALNERWLDAYRAVNPVKRDATCCIDDLTADPDELLEERIDYVFLAPGDPQVYVLTSVEPVLHQPSRVDVGWLWASDHVGLLVELKLQR